MTIEAMFYCKGTSRSLSKYSELSDLSWVDNFTEGNWYDGEYELWYDESENERKKKYTYLI